MTEREHFTNGRCFAFAGGSALMAAAFGAQVGTWSHWIMIGIGYGSGGLLILLSTIWITRSYYSRQDVVNDGEVVPKEPPATETTGTSLFTPLQVQAFELAAEIGRFLEELGPRPYLVDDDSAFTVTKQMRQQAFARNRVVPWVRKLTSTYAEDFAPRVRSIVNQFGKEGLGDAYLRQHSQWIQNETNLREIQRRIICLAHGADGVDVERSITDGV